MEKGLIKTKIYFKQLIKIVYRYIDNDIIINSFRYQSK